MSQRKIKPHWTEHPMYDAVQEPGPTQQPEALRLAEWLESFDHTKMNDAAAEMRRLHSVNQQLLEALEELMYANTDKAARMCWAAIAAAKGIESNA